MTAPHVHTWAGTHDAGIVCAVCGQPKPDHGALREQVAELVYDRDSFAGDLHWSRTAPTERDRCRRIADALLAGPLACHDCGHTPDQHGPYCGTEGHCECDGHVSPASEPYVTSLRAERDQAVATLQRVRQLEQDTTGIWPGIVTSALRRALDGKPGA